MKKDQLIFLVAQKDYTVEEPQREDLYKIGVVAKIVQLLNSGSSGLRIMVEGVYKASITDITSFSPYMECTVKSLSDPQRTNVPADVEEAMVRAVTDSFDLLRPSAENAQRDHFKRPLPEDRQRAV